MIDPETEYLMLRAQAEAILAIRAGHPAAAEAHQELAVRYSSQAVTELAGAGHPTLILPSPPHCAIVPPPKAAATARPRRG